MTDSELSLKLKNVSEGDIKAFEDIYNDMKKPVMTVIMRVVGNRETAEDLLQEVFVKLYRSPPKDVSKPRAYIFKTAGNLLTASEPRIGRSVSTSARVTYMPTFPTAERSWILNVLWINWTSLSGG